MTFIRAVLIETNRVFNLAELDLFFHNHGYLNIASLVLGDGMGLLDNIYVKIPGGPLITPQGKPTCTPNDRKRNMFCGPTGSGPGDPPSHSSIRGGRAHSSGHRGAAPQSITGPAQVSLLVVFRWSQRGGKTRPQQCPRRSLSVCLSAPVYSELVRSLPPVFQLFSSGVTAGRGRV